MSVHKNKNYVCARPRWFKTRGCIDAAATYILGMSASEHDDRELFTGKVTVESFDPAPRNLTFSTATIRNLATETPGLRHNASIESYGAAVLALGSKQDEDHGIFGTAVMVAPGVALTARHVLEMFRAAHRGNIDAGIQLFGAKNGAIFVWEVTEVVLNDPNDIAILMVHPLTDLPPGNIVDVLALTAARRSTDEAIEIFGFRAEQPTEIKGNETIFHLAAYLAAGPITEVYPERRDSSLCPFPCVEVMTDTVGGMSGGPAFDPAGDCFGLVSTSIAGGPTWVSLLWPVMAAPFQPIWPQGMYRGPVTLKSLSDSGVATITEGFRVGTMRLHNWIDPQVQFALNGQLKLRGA